MSWCIESVTQDPFLSNKTLKLQFTTTAFPSSNKSVADGLLSDSIWQARVMITIYHIICAM